MADIVSQAFKEGKCFFASNSLITYFNHTLSLPQNQSCQECHISTEWLFQGIACMHGNQFQMAWLQILPKIAKNTGIFGVNTPMSAQSILSSPTNPAPSNAMSLLQHQLIVLGQVCTSKTLQLKFRESRTLSCPSPRPSNWPENLVLSTGKNSNTR